MPRMSLESKMHGQYFQTLCQGCFYKNLFSSPKMSLGAFRACQITQAIIKSKPYSETFNFQFSDKMSGVSKCQQLAIQQDFESATMSSSVICTVLHQGRSHNQECEAPSPRLYDKLKLQKKKFKIKIKKFWSDCKMSSDN